MIDDEAAAVCQRGGLRGAEGAHPLARPQQKPEPTASCAKLTFNARCGQPLRLHAHELAGTAANVQP
jgi:hypothetical protein